MTNTRTGVGGPRRRGFTTSRHVFAAFVILVICEFWRSGTNRLSSGWPAPVESRRSDLEYDRSVTTFSDDGRLLQVDYSTIAANDRGTVTMACLEVPGVPNNDETTTSPNAVVVGIVEEDSSSCSSSLTSRSEQRLVFRLDDHCLLFTTGLVGDGRLVATALRRWCQQYRLQYGEAPTVAQIAKEALGKEWHHRRTLVAGTRPLAVTVSIVGVSAENTVELYQSEPGTLLAKPYDCCVAGKNRMALLDDLVQLQQDLAAESSLQENTATKKSNRFAALKTRAVRGILSLLLGKDDAKTSGSRTSTSETGSTTERSAEIWIVEPCVGRRGNVRIQCAKRLTTEEASGVIQKLCRDKDDEDDTINEQV